MGKFLFPAATSYPLAALGCFFFPTSLSASLPHRVCRMFLFLLVGIGTNKAAATQQQIPFSFFLCR